MHPSRRHNPLWLVLASLLSLAGTWLYAQRVLVAFQVADAAVHDRPRGNLSDLYPRWLGARELLLRGRNPYSPEVSREIQMGYYGRALDPSRPGDPQDQQAFAYPVYVVFYLAPTVHLPFAVVQRVFFWVLLALALVSALLWLHVVRWPLSWWAQLSCVAFVLGSLAVMQGLKLQQITLAVAALIALAMVLLVTGRATAAGVLLALATIKPQLVAPLVVWLAVWTLGDWRQRYRWAVAFAVTMAVLAGGAELCLPHWLPQFLQAVREYQAYTGAVPLLDKLLPAPLGLVLEFVAGIAAVCVGWRNKKSPVASGTFVVTTCLTLAVTLLLVPSYALYNQVLLLPALLLMVRDRGSIWGRSFAGRLLLVTVTILLAWQWLSTTVLAGLSFLLPAAVVERVWYLPGWTVLTLPVAVTALMLVMAHRASLGDSEEPIPS